MIYIPDSEIDRWLLEDIGMGDVTTRSLGIGREKGRISFVRRQAGCVSGVAVAVNILQKLGLQIKEAQEDGLLLEAGDVLLRAEGQTAALHQAWKVTQNILEWCGGVADGMYALVQVARSVNPHIQIACTRKSIPGTRLLASRAVLDGGGIIHRLGTAETVLVFANHRRFLESEDDFQSIVARLRYQAPEKKIVLEADLFEEAFSAMDAQPDVLQLDKFSPQDIQKCVERVQELGLHVHLAATGGINIQNVAAYAATGVPLLVTSAPYYSKPADVQVVLEPM